MLSKVQTLLQQGQMSARRLGAYTLLSALALGVSSYYLWHNVFRNSQLRMACGGSGEDERLVLCRAIAQVVAEKFPRLRIQVIPSRGVDDNIKFLRSGQADLILSLSSLPMPNRSRVVARLMPAVLQIIVRQNSGITSPADLRGRKVLVQNRASVDILKPLLRSYGINPKEVYFLIYSGSGNDYWKYLSTKITSVTTPDVIQLAFTPGNPYIAGILDRVPSQLISLPNAKALALLTPGLVPYTIPQGLYQGKPPLPPQDLQTVAAYRLLLANEKVEPGLIRDVVSVLSENRNALVNALPENLSYFKAGLAEIRIPSSDNDYGPLHPGVVSFNYREQPSLLKENVSIFSFALTLYVFLWSRWSEIRGRRYRRKLLEVDALLKQLQDIQQRLMSDLEQGLSQQSSVECWHVYQQELLHLMAQMTEFAQQNRIKAEDLALFRSLWTALHGSVTALLRGSRLSEQHSAISRLS
jgi:TRAP-type uncharacterized transport system substrate-binding protein